LIKWVTSLRVWHRARRGKVKKKKEEKKKRKKKKRKMQKLAKGKGHLAQKDERCNVQRGQ
jgi:hypothetical protein